MIIHPPGKKPRTVNRVPIAERQKRISEGLRLAHKWKRVATDRLWKLCSELDEELDGVRMPASAAAIMNAIRNLLKENG